MRRRVCFVVALGGLLFCSGLQDGQALAGPAARLRACSGQRRLMRRHCFYVSAVNDTSDSVASAVALGDQLREKKDWDGAIAAYTKAIGLDPRCAKAFCGRGRALGNKGNLDASMADVNEAIRLDPNNPRAFCTRGRNYHDRSDFDKAIADYSEAIRLDPKLGWAFEARAAAYWDKGLLDAALVDLNEAIRIDPKCADAFCTRGAAFAAKGKYDRAMSDHNEAIRLNPRLPSAYLYRGDCYRAQRQFDKAIADMNEAIRLDPKNVKGYLFRSRVRASQKKWQKAQEDLSEAIRLCPNSPFHYERRAVAWINCGDHDRGIADLQTVFRLKPQDQAAAFENWPKTAVSFDAMRHGRRQVEQMLKDRPAMAQYGDKALPLQQWAARKFAGEDLGQTIRWDGTDPVRAWCAECGAMTRIVPLSSPPSQISLSQYIRVRRRYNDGSEKGKDRSFEELWSNAVFELNNNASYKDFNRVIAEAAAGRLSRREYARKIMEAEGAAAEKTRSFYIHVFLPWARQERLPTNPHLWFVGWRSDPKQNLFLLAMSEGDPHWRYYEGDHDMIVMCSLVASGQHEKADLLAAEMEKRATTTAEKAAVYMSRSQLYGATGNLEKAIADSSRAIRLNAKNCMAYFARGNLYAQRNDFDRAIADYNEAIRLDRAFADAYHNLVVAREKKGQLDRALAACDEGIRHCPKDASLHVARGFVLAEGGDLDKGLAEVKAALRLDPKNEDARSLRREISRQAAEVVADGKLGSPGQATPIPSYGLDEALEAPSKQVDGASNGQTQKR
jgi:tetratricopeptide (TPR) repeat protein